MPDHNNSDFIATTFPAPDFNPTAAAAAATAPDRAAINRANAQHSTGPKTAAGKRAIRFNAMRLGLTSQVACMPWEDREAFDKFCAALVADYHPEGAIESQFAQSIAEGQWRLNRARTLETNALSLAAMTGPLPFETGEPQADVALAQAKAFFEDPASFGLLSLYEQRINRNIIKNEERLLARQSARRAALEKLVAEEQDLAAVEARRRPSTAPSAQPESATPPATLYRDGFVFSTAEVAALIDRKNRLAIAARMRSPLDRAA